MEAADIIREHLNDDVYALSAKDKWFDNWDKRWLLQQIQSRQKAQSKLPSWYGNFDLLFPSPLSVEQASSELTADYKSQMAEKLAPDHRSLLDLTGGMGVDDAAFAARFQQVIYVENQNEVAETAKHNFHQLKLENVEVNCADAAAFLAENCDKKYDCIFMDPARRKNGQKVFRLEDCEPNVLKLWPLLTQQTPMLMLKLSPMLDIHQLMRTLPLVAEIHVVAVHNEVKELLCIFNTQNTEISAANPQIFCVNLENNGVKKAQFSYGERNAVVDLAENVGRFLYEPHPTLMKAEMMNEAANKLNLQKLHPHSHLYTSDELHPDFFGRIFEVESVFGMGKSELKAGLSGLDKALITVRNFPLTEAELRKRLKLADGGDITLIATTLTKNKHVIIKTKRVINVIKKHT